MPDSVLIEAIRAVIREELRAQFGEPSASMRYGPLQILRRELREMSDCIDQARKEVAGLRPTKMGSNRIMAATEELDAIVSATERATSSILTSAERIQDLSERLPKDGEIGCTRRAIETEVTEILTTCSFQDITGQRTTKVVNALRYLEQRVNAMVEIWGVYGSRDDALSVPDETGRKDAHLLNGPPSQGGVSQDDVDALLADADPSDQKEGNGGASADPAARTDRKGGKSPATQAEIDSLFG